jgi:hypothetical protein
MCSRCARGQRADVTAWERLPGVAGSRRPAPCAARIAHRAASSGISLDTTPIRSHGRRPPWRPCCPASPRCCAASAVRRPSRRRRTARSSAPCRVRRCRRYLAVPAAHSSPLRRRPAVPPPSWPRRERRRLPVPPRGRATATATRARCCPRRCGRASENGSVQCASRSRVAAASLLPAARAAIEQDARARAATAPVDLA